MRRGMSLIEVLVAVAIFALAAVGLSAAYGNILLARAAMIRLEADDEAMRLVRAAVLAPDALGNRQVRAAGERLSGRVTLSDATVAEWEAELAPVELDALFLVKLTVRREGDVAESTQSFQLYRPAWAATADRQARQRLAAEKLRAERGFEGTSAAAVAPAGGSRATTRPSPPRGGNESRGGGKAGPGPDGSGAPRPPAGEGGRPR
ncbi:MAG: prepilin-type N-terminal cleavage/methylation domain-containing protein [Opitutia bacterium]